MNRQLASASLRRCNSRSLSSLKTDPQFKSMVRAELKDMINWSVHEYLQHHKIPVASIDIKLDKDCKHCAPDCSRRESPRNIRFNISTSSIDREIQTKASDIADKEVIKKNDDENVHWMTWRDPTPFFTKKKDLKNYRLQTAQTHTASEHRCASPFTRPTTSSQPYNNKDPDKDSSTEYRPYSRDSVRRVKCFNNTSPQVLHEKMSVAVGPDKQFHTTATNTQKTYQISDYLKKSLNLNDPYERQVFSSLMEVLRKRNRSDKDIDTEAIAVDHIVQLSEYKSKYRNPLHKAMNFPTTKTENKIGNNRPPLCPHKTRPLGQLRPQTSNTYRYDSREQYLY